ncbi:remodeling and spacing factor 1 [Pholidichthys leucotaenia]
MAAPELLSGSGPPLCPSFAEVCSFMERYGAALELPEIPIPRMEEYLRDTGTVPKPLVDLHVKLLRKLGKSVTVDRWEKYLVKLCSELNGTWAWELEQKGYQEMSMECKSTILKYLCECQFDENIKFKMVVNDEDPETMRLQPIGRDRQGLMYWLQVDQDQNIRLYTEEQDDLDGSSWRCIVRSRNDLAQALELLKAQNRNQTLDQDQDQDQVGSRTSSPVQRQPEVKLESVKQEVAQSDLRPCVIDHHVSTITAIVKQETPTNAVSVVMALGATKQEVEAERAVVRSSQQAKIPLKKRELKLADSFHSNSIIVCNPAVIQNPSAIANGRAPVPASHKDGQNGVIVGHVGVIRSLSDRPRNAEPNGPKKEDKVLEAGRRSVLVSKKLGEAEALPATATTPPPPPTPAAAQETQRPPQPPSPKPPSRKPDPPPEEEDGKRQLEEGDHKKKKEEEVNAGSVDQEVKGAGPVVEASSEIQKEGIRLKIKIPPHRRRSRLRGRREEEPQPQQQQEEERGRTLRRSARICRYSDLTCRPSTKAAESQKKKPLRKPGRPRKEEQQQQQQQQEEERSSTNRAVTTRRRRGKRRHRRHRWSNVRTKRSKLTEGGEEEEEEENEGGSGSEEEQEEKPRKKEEIPSEDACTHCGLPNHPELILLCDSCDCGYHTACLRPPLMLIPDGEWFCPPCQHKLLCEKLEEQLQNLDTALKKKERAERRRERLVYVGISVENIIPGDEDDDEEEEEKSAKRKKEIKKSRNLGRRSTRTRKLISYRFDDFDDAIDEAIEDDIGDVRGGVRFKDDSIIQSEDVKESKQPNRSRNQRSRKRRRLNDLESDSTESEDEFMMSNSSEEDFVVSGVDDVDDEDDEDDEGETGSWDGGRRSRRAMRGMVKLRRSRTQRRGRKRKRRRSEEEESDEELDSDQLSDMSDDDGDKKRQGLRRGQRQQVNYRETSESSDNSGTSDRQDKPRRRGRPRKERLSSDYSDASPSSRESEEDCEEEEDQRRRVKRRRREEEEEDFRRSRDKRRGDEEEEEDEQRGRKLKLKGKVELERMGRGRRREVLSQQRRKRLALMLKKQHSSTEEEEEEESSSEEDRPVRKRLNRIDSDEEDQEEEEEEEEGERATNREETRERGRGHSPPSTHGQRTSRCGAKTKGVLTETRRGGEEEEQTDSLNCRQNDL